MRLSVTRASRKREIFLALLVRLDRHRGPPAQWSTPIPVKTTPRNEVSPSASGDWLVWSRSRERGTSPFDLFAQHGTDPAFKINRKDTQAYGGGIDGTRLLYQLIRGQYATESDLRLYDLQTRRLTPLPAGVNTKNWECCGTISGDWILFSRGRAYGTAKQQVILRNLVTGEQRVLDRLRNRDGAPQRRARSTGATPCGLAATRIRTASSTGTTWRPPRRPRCPPCRTRSPTARRSTCTGRSTTSGARGAAARSVEIVKQTLVGGPEVLATLPQGRDVDVTYASTAAAGSAGLGVRRSLLRHGHLPTPDVGHLPRRRSRAATAALAGAGDDHVLEELAGAAAGSPVDVTPVARLDRQPRPLEYLRVEVAAVVDHDHDRRARP